MFIALVDIFDQGYRFLWGLHLLGVVFGLGGATVTDVMFLKFMRNFRIDRHEKELMETLSIVVWVGIGLLVLTGLAMMATDWEAFVSSDRFLMKMTTVAVVIINGVALNMWIQPRARRISFVEPDHELTDEERREHVWIRRTAFGLGAVSFISWYGAFSLAILDMVALSYLSFFGIFVALLVIGVIGSQLHERKYRKEVEEETSEQPLEA